MIGAFEGFRAALRRAGLPASPAEWLDALRAVEVVGIDDRLRLREALRCTLVKRAAHAPTFDGVFDRWFAAPARAGDPRCAGRSAVPGGAGRSGAPPREGEGRSPSARPRAARDAPGTPPARDRERFRREIGRLADGRSPGHGRLRHVAIPDRAGVQSAARTPGADRNPTRVDLRGRMATADESALAEAVPRIVERLRLRPSRRARRSLRGRADWRHVFRANAGTGGVPFLVPRRRPRPRRTRVVLAVDVSWSTARSAALFLSMAGAFLAARRLLGATRVIAFVDRAVDATDAVVDWLESTPLPAGANARTGRTTPGSGIARGGVSFAGLVDGLAGLDPGAPSDYGRAFHDLLTSPLRPRGRGTLLVVLGDGRTNRYDPQGWTFDELAAGCGAVVWLACEPAATWCSGDSALDVYLPACDVAVETRDLAGLERGVAALAGRL